jgi:para-nitrobenzyl esterase
MKKQLQFFGVILFFCFSQFSYGQFFPNYCGSLRYDTEVFSADTIISNVLFGSNIDVNGNTVNLTMDIYLPKADTATIRPLIVWVHGGSFVSGTKNDGDVTSLCNHFAKRGYVCASINYRLGIPLPPDQTGATRAVFRAVQDMKAAIRFFRKDAATANSYKIDSNVVFAGGSSAGAFTALHLAYLNEPSELPSQIDTLLLGGLEGGSGNPGYTSTVNAVINLCGALGDTSWLVPGDVPVCSMHGTADNIVPYATSMLNLFGTIPIMVVNGSHSVNARANSIGVPNVMYTFYAANHVPFASNTAYMDTTVRFVSNFLYHYFGCAPVDPNPLPNTFTGTVSVSEINSSHDEVTVYPNPSNGTLHVKLENNSVKSLKISLADLTGRTIYENTFMPDGEVTVPLENISSGIYLMKLKMNGKESIRKICIR